MPQLKLSLQSDVPEKSKKASAAFGGFVTSMNQGLQLVENLGGKAFRALDQVFETAGKAEQLTSGFVALSGSAEQADENLNAITEALHGTVSEMEAMEIANTALSFGLADSAEGLGDLASVGAVLAQSLGMDAAKGVGDLTLALSRSSPMILDNLGISLKLSDAYKAEAGNLGKMVSELTDAEKKQAFFNEAMRLGREKVEELGGFVVSASTKFDTLTARTDDAKVAFSTMLAEAVEPLLDSLLELSDVDPKFLAEGAGQALGDLAGAFGGLNDDIALTINGTSRFDDVLTGLFNPIDAATRALSLLGAAAKENALASQAVANASEAEAKFIKLVNDALGTEVETMAEAVKLKNENREAVKSYKDSLEDQEKATAEASKATGELLTAEEELARVAKEAKSELEGAMKTLGLTTEDTIEGQKKAEEEFRKSFEVMEESGLFTTEQLSDAWDEFFGKVKDGSGAMQVEVIGDHTQLVSDIQTMLGPGIFSEEDAAMATWVDREKAELLARQEEIMGPISDAIEDGIETGLGDADIEGFGEELNSEVRISVADAMSDPDLARQLAQAFGIAIGQSIEDTDTTLGTKGDLSKRDQKKIDNLLLTTNGQVAQSLQGMLNALEAGDLSFIEQAIGGAQANLALSRKFGNSVRDREFRETQGATLAGMREILDLFGVKIPGFARGGVGEFGGGSLVKLHQAEAIIPLEESGDRISQAIMGGSVVELLADLVAATGAQTDALSARLDMVADTTREAGAGGGGGGMAETRRAQRRARSVRIALDPAEAVA